VLRTYMGTLAGISSPYPSGLSISEEAELGCVVGELDEI